MATADLPSRQGALGTDGDVAPRTWPWATIVLTAACCLFMTLPAIGSALEYHRERIAAGELWRLFTGHLVHCDATHLFWDVVVFAVLGALLERRARWSFYMCLAISAAAISASLWLFHAEMLIYRGLSGLDTALFTLLAGTLLIEQWRARQWRYVSAIGLLLIGLAVKTLFELLTGATLFVDSVEANFVPVPLAHIVGGIVGAVMAPLVARQGADADRQQAVIS